MSTEPPKNQPNPWWAGIIVAVIGLLGVIGAAYINKPNPAPTPTPTPTATPPATPPPTPETLGVSIKGRQNREVVKVVAKHNVDEQGNVSAVFPVAFTTTGEAEGRGLVVCLIAHRSNPSRAGWYLQNCESATRDGIVTAYDGGSSTGPQKGDRLEVRAVLVKESKVKEFRSRKGNGLVQPDAQELGKEGEIKLSQLVEFEIAEIQPQ